jgi:hypothetical protein
MIKINGNEVIVEAEQGKEYSKFLWEVADLMSSRFSIIALNKKKSKVDYEKMEKIKAGSQELLLMQCDNEMDYLKIIDELSSNLIHDFYLIINSSIKTIKSEIEEADDFEISEWISKKYPKTIHVSENGFRIDLETFSNYAFQIERIVGRFNK